MDQKRFAISIEYEWVPFRIDGKHYLFREDNIRRLARNSVSHLGAAIYKWQGQMESGPNKGKVGVLVGETHDIRDRINQYKTGTQKDGNKYWREEFLEMGDMRLYILSLGSISYNGVGGTKALTEEDLLDRKNTRVILEEILVFEERQRNSTTSWIVNKWDQALESRTEEG